MASGVPAVCVRRDGVGVLLSVAAVVLGVAGLPGVAAAPAVLVFVGSGWVVFSGVAAPVLSVLAAPVSVDVAVLSPAVAAVAFVSVPSSALPVLVFAMPACACCPAAARGCIASAMAAMGIVELTMDVHAIAQSR